MTNLGKMNVLAGFSVPKGRDKDTEQILHESSWWADEHF